MAQRSKAFFAISCSDHASGPRFRSCLGHVIMMEKLWIKSNFIPVLNTRYLSLPFNRTLKRLKGNRSQWSLKVGPIHVNPQIGSCQIMFELCRIHFVSTWQYYPMMLWYTSHLHCILSKSSNNFVSKGVGFCGWL